jgi:thiamine transport system substrate-binding protein
LDPTHELTPIDFGDVCVNYDRAALAHRGVPAPTSLDDLAKPAYRGMLVVENAASSSPGLAFLLATIAKYGDGWRDYWADLRANGIKVDDGWEQAYFTDFAGGGQGGSYPLVVSYASSPPAGVADGTPAEAPTAAVLDTCFRQVEFAGVLRGAEHPALARELVDWMLSRRFQAAVPEQMYVYPVREGVAVPASWSRYAPVPAQPFRIAPARIARNRTTWIDQWTDTVLR